MQASHKVSNIHEVVVEAPRFDERTLSVEDEGGHVRAKPDSEHLRDDLGDCMDKANGPKVDDALGDCTTFAMIMAK